MPRSKQVSATTAVLSALNAGVDNAADIARGTRSTMAQVRGALMSLQRNKFVKRINPKAKPGTPARYRIMAKGRKALQQ